MFDSGYQLARQYYALVRKLSFEVAEQQARAHSGITVPFRFSEIDAAARNVWRSAWTRPQPLGYGGWEWPRIAGPILRRPTGFTLAIWSGGWLCGLCAGRTSKRRPSGVRHTLSLSFLEGNPDPDHPLRGYVAPLAISTAEAYARALGISRVRLIEPLPGVFRIYERLGYQIVREGASRVYFEKRM